VGDEMVLKSMLDILRHYVHYLKETPGCIKTHLANLYPLVNLKDDNDDFFASFLAIKMKTR
jgi:hypothetical protein